MKIGLVSYTYHRFFGDVYEPVQTDPGVRWDMLEVVRKAEELGIDGVLLDTPFYPSLDRTYLRRLARALDDAKLERAVSWGNPSGLNTGKSPEAVQDLIRHIEVMEILGANTLRIVGGSKRTAHEPHGPALDRLASVITEHCLGPAERAGVVLAYENHWDYTADEVLGLIRKVDSPWLKVTFDSGNALRVGDNPVEAARKLAPYIICTNLKDIGHPTPGATDWRAQFPCVPLGRGRINHAEICRIMEETGSLALHALEMDRPREDCLDEELYVRECVGYLRGLRDQLKLGLAEPVVNHRNDAPARGVVSLGSTRTGQVLGST
jgi:sugar phosphate isomerase/epimerase